MLEKLKDFLSAYLAGALIALGCSIFWLSGGGIVGAILFSIALTTICYLKLNLFTGKVGFLLAEKKIDFLKLLVILLGNLVGAFVMGCLLNTLPIVAAASFTLPQLEFAMAGGFACGMLMYIAVKLFQFGQPLGIFLCVPAFILSGFTHSIALIGYITLAQMWSWQSLATVGMAVLGNSLGAYFVSLNLKILEEF